MSLLVTRLRKEIQRLLGLVDEKNKEISEIKKSMKHLTLKEV
jgi:hypothetical protein